MVRVCNYLVIAIVAGGLLFGASAEAKEQLTASLCLNKAAKPEKLACFTKLKEQRKRELATATARADEAKNEAKQLDIEIEALRKVRALQEKSKRP